MGSTLRQRKVMGWAAAYLECTKCHEWGEIRLGMYVYDPRLERRFVCQVCK